MPAFELAFALGGIGPAIDELNAQAHADTLQGLGTVGGAVIDDQFAAHAALEQGLLEHALDVQRRLAQAEGAVRSEEHTSELQSLMRISYAVFCLTKNNQQQPNTSHSFTRTQTAHTQHNYKLELLQT